MENMFEQLLEQAGRGFISVLPFVFIAGVLLFVYKFVHDKLTPYDDDQHALEGNLAVAWSRGGAYLGIVCALAGSFVTSDERDYVTSLTMFALDGLVALVVLSLAVNVFDYVIVKGINNDEHIAGGNTAAGVVQGTAYVALGLITGASFSGGGQKLLPGLGSAALYSLLGMVTLAATYFLYCMYWKMRRYDVDGKVASGDYAAAANASLFLLAMAITLWFSISGDFTGWANDLLAYVLAVLSSVLVVPLGRYLAGRLICHALPKDSLVRAIIVGLSGVGFGLLVGLWQFSS